MRLLFFFLLSFAVYAQSVDDAINYNFNNDIGNSRFTSMGGAFGALGGNLSSISINPASGSVFEMSRLGGSFAIESNNIESNFNNNFNERKKSSTQFQGGIIYVFKNYGEGKLNKFSFGFNFQSSNSYNNDILISGNNDSSIDKFFLNNASGLNPSEISVNNNESISSVYRWLGNNYGYYAQQAFLGYQSYLLNYDDNSNSFYSLAKYDNGLSIKNEVFSSGNKSKASLNLSGLFNKNLYFGFNINIYETNINKEIIHSEDNFDSESIVRFINFNNYLQTSGIGFSLQAGLIYKISNLRLGLSYESPNWFNFEDQLEQEIEVQSFDSNNEELYVDIVDPRIVNIYEYNYRTPSKLTFSAATVIRNMLILSFDLENINYSKSKFSSADNTVYNNLNLAINRNLSSLYNIRFGSELRINKFSIRGGFKQSNSPYDKSTIKLSSKSFGIGYEFKKATLDIGFSINDIKSEYQLFDTGLVNLAQINNSQLITVISYNIIF